MPFLPVVWFVLDIRGSWPMFCEVLTVSACSQFTYISWPTNWWAVSKERTEHIPKLIPACFATRAITPLMMTACLQLGYFVCFQFILLRSHLWGKYSSGTIINHPKDNCYTSDRCKENSELLYKFSMLPLANERLLSLLSFFVNLKYRNKCYKYET